jgi:Xaa-Pro aminopeptidase
MEESGISLWLVLCREYNEDPVFKTLIPRRCKNASRLSCLAFCLEDGRFRAVNLGKPDPRLKPFYEQGYDPKTEDQWEAIGGLIKQYGPRRAVNISGDCAMADGISAFLYRELEKRLPPGGVLEKAEPLVIRWLETRSGAELTLYGDIYASAMAILEEAYSRDLIKPGLTTTTDVEAFIHRRILDLGYGAWFFPDVDLQRRGGEEFRMRETVIEAGDLLHTDMGIEYLGLCTDTQRLAYVLREGEREIPAGIQRGFNRALRFQDLTAEQFVENRSGNEILRLSLERGRAEGLRPMLYSHPIGVYGHAAGPCIGLFDNQNFVPGSGENRLHRDSCFALELNVTERAPEWEQDVCFMLEETVIYADGVVQFMDKRRDRIYTL